jgi:hypothetical protein
MAAILKGDTLGHTDDDDLITLADGIATVAGEISVTTLDIGGTNVGATAAEINDACDASARTAAAITVANDHFLFCDGAATGATRVESIADLATAQASTGLTAANGAFTITPGQTTITSVINASLGKIGTAADQEYVTFGTSNEVNTFINDTERLSVTAAGADVTGDLTISGDLTVSGDTVTTNVATVTVEDPMIKLASGNSSTDTVDIGFYGLCDPSNSQDTFTGLVRDATDAEWHLFDLLQTEPTTTMNKSATGFDHADLTVGALTADDASTFTAGLTTGALTATANLDIGAYSLRATQFTSDIADGTAPLVVTSTTEVANLNSATATLATTATTATNVTVSANDSTNETVYPVFVDGATGTQGAETDTGLTYNPASGMLTATTLAGTLSTAAQTAVTSLGTLTALTVDDVNVNGKVITMTGDTSDTVTMTAAGAALFTIATSDNAGTDGHIVLDADGDVKLDAASGITRFLLAGDADDLCTLTVAANGATTLATADSDGTAGHLTLDVDGNITLDADGGTVTFADAGSSLGTITSSGWTGDVVGDVTGNADTATKIASITNSNIVQLTASQTLTNKTLTAPTLTTPALGTPASGVLTNCTALPAAQVAQGTMASGMVLVAPALGTPASGVLTNCSGTASSLTAGTATVATTVTIADNEATNEENAILFSAGADADGGNLGVEQDHSGLTYNPSSGTLTATALAGTLSTAAQTAVTSLGTLTALVTSGGVNLVDGGDGAINGCVIGGATAAAGTFTTLDCTNGAFALDNLDIDGGTGIGAALVDADLIIVDDGAGGTNRKCPMSRVKTYIDAVAAGSANTFTAKQQVDLAAGNYTPSADGSHLHIEGGVSMNDNSTSGSGTAAAFSQVSIEAVTLTATNSSVTTTNAATLAITAAPTAGTNHTLTNSFGLMVGVDDAGADVKFFGDTAGDYFLWDTSTNAIRVEGQIGVGKAAANSYAIDVINTASAAGRVRANAFVTYSARELKKDIQPLNNPMDKLNKLQGVSYNWKGTSGWSKGWKSQEVGFIADEVAKVLPQIAMTDDAGKSHGIDYGKLTAVLTEAVKQQDTEIKNLRTTLSTVLESQELLLQKLGIKK